MNSLLILLIIIISSTNYIFSQSIHHVWYSEENNSCIEFDSLTGRMNMGLLHDNYKEGKQRMEYKVIDNKLKVLWYFNQTIFGYQKWIYWFDINELTENNLTMTFFPPEENRVTEFFGGTKVRFTKININCHDLFRIKKNN